MQSANEGKLSLGGATSVTLRPVGPDDEAFLARVYASTRNEELALLPWSEEQKQAFLEMQFAAQQQHYQSHYTNSTHEIILLNERPIGRIYVARMDQEIRILDFTLLPEYRNAGIGTPIIKKVLAEAAKVGKPVRIYVESYNASLRLLERLGFSRIADEGINYLLEWRPHVE